MIRTITHLLFVLFLLGWAMPARAERIIIRDAEIESMIEEWARPVIQSAGLSPSAVNIILVQSPETNAFVAGGQNIFLYTGLLQKTDNAGEVVGVIAHELGHIAGGHLIRAQGQMERASYEAMLGALLGMGVAVATGSGDVGAAIIGGASTYAQRNVLSFSRTQEAAADQAGVRFLKESGLNPNGLVTFMEKLADQELLPASQQNEYVRTHPLSRDRVDYLESTLGDSPLRLRPLPASWADQHARMKAKLLGFITPQQVMWTYDDRDHSIPADYARAIAAYRQNQVDDALHGIDGLIAREPKNPYFYELKGQALYDFGRVAQAVSPYARAVELAPGQPLIRLAYAQSLIEQPGADAAQLQRAITMLERVRNDESRNTRVYRLLATAYGRLKREGDAQAMLAEEAFLQARYDQSRQLANGALANLPEGARARQGVRDLLALLDQVKDKKKK